jgi:RNA polymerase primary sigma factor
LQDAIKLFFDDVGRRNLLTREEEVELSQKIEMGDKIARQKMIESNIRLAISIAKKYQNKGCPLEDLIQESNIGLMKAVDRFDWRRGFKFSTYACWWIKQAVRRHVASHSSSIRLPAHAKSLFWKMRQASEAYEDEFGSAPSQEELAELLGVTVSTMKAVIACANTPLSLDKRTSYNGSSGPSEGRKLADIIADENADPAQRIDKEKIVMLVRGALETLDEREEKIIRLRFGISEDPTNHHKFPISNADLLQIKQKAKRELKK